MSTFETSKESEFQADFFYSCLYNSLVLFASSPSYLDSLAGPAFDIVFELEDEFLYAFHDVFDEHFLNGKVSEILREDLLSFKNKVDAIPPELWNWEQIISNSIWEAIRLSAEDLLVKLGESRRTYDSDFTVIIPA